MSRCPGLAKRLTGTENEQRAKAAMAVRRQQLSEMESVREGASFEPDSDGVLPPGKPKYCMCWWMELDDR